MGREQPRRARAATRTAPVEALPAEGRVAEDGAGLQPHCGRDQDLRLGAVDRVRVRGAADGHLRDRVVDDARQRMGSQGRGRMCRDFSEKLVIQRYVDAVRRLGVISNVA